MGKDLRGPLPAKIFQTIVSAKNLVEIERCGLGSELFSTWTKESYLDLFRSSLYDYFYMKSPGNVAFLIAKKMESEYEIIQWAVQVKSAGFGSLFLRSVLTRMKEDGAFRVILEHAQNNISAHKLYARLGFKVDAIRINYYKSGQDAILMSLPL